MLGRPHRVEPLLASIAAATTTPHRVLFLCTPTDVAVLAAVADAGGVHLEVPWQPVGDYARKINAGVAATDEPLIFTGADDLHFHPGWLEEAAARLSDTVGVVGTNDLCNPRVMSGRHATHSLVARWYVERLGTIDERGKMLHEGYVHEFVDDELVGTARRRRAFAFAAGAHVEHLHPDVGKAPPDALYAAQGARMDASRAHYRRRSRLWR